MERDHRNGFCFDCGFIRKTGLIIQIVQIVHPHFFFNTFNYMFSLVQEITQEAIIGKNLLLVAWDNQDFLSSAYHMQHTGISSNENDTHTLICTERCITMLIYVL